MEFEEFGYENKQGFCPHFGEDFEEEELIGFWQDDRF